MIFDDRRAGDRRGRVAVVVVALLAALTLVPALLEMVGGRIPAPAVAPTEGSSRGWPARCSGGRKVALGSARCCSPPASRCSR